MAVSPSPTPIPKPTIFFEYAFDVASLAHEAGLKNVFVSNGYMGEEAAQKIIPLMDGINIDLKGDDQFYRKVCGVFSPTQF
ncbi:MAG: hypothetical protein NTY37_12395 [Methanothrix sp.]|nr:hypothetical protein [Methanothrix sp.]